MGRQRQRLEGCINKPRNPKDYQPPLHLRERPRTDSFQKEPTLLMPWLGTPSLQNCETTNLSPLFPQLAALCPQSGCRLDGSFPFVKTRRAAHLGTLRSSLLYTPQQKGETAYHKAYAWMAPRERLLLVLN